ncbi:E3 ubiquitin-protein ligase TRIM56 [Holothuria leucospilota]|uniref:E3 ubiquitin-protein ligase TRIM56 n=1 Tax=Holothuria leucospilota TaxID=206669 RepID=A0A9Q0YDY0_HOLLE|nr:E3 ubiquitin-protein ligase TRIM56 [Holothuria leucospilota]
MAENKSDSLSEDFLHCSICTELYNQPKILPCLHSFCLHCLERMVSSRHHDQPLSCPICRYTVDLPNSGVNGFPRNFFLVGLIERLNEARALSTQRHNLNCTFCGRAVGTLFCLECKLLSCSDCKRNHDRVAGTTEHLFVSSERLTDENYLQRMISTRSMRCDTHKEEKLRYFCTQCSQLACQVCAIVSHQGHQSIQEVVSKGNLVKAQWEAFLESSEIQERELRIMSYKAKSNAESIKQQTSTLSRDVDARYSAIIEKLQSDREKLRQELQVVENANCAHLRDIDDRISNLLQPIENTLQMTRTILVQNNPKEIIEMERIISESFQRLKTETDLLKNISLPESVYLFFSASKLIVLDGEKEKVLRNAELRKREQSSGKKGRDAKEEDSFEYLRDQNWLGNFSNKKPHRVLNVLSEFVQKMFSR